MDITETLAERGDKYNVHGSYADHAALTQTLKKATRNHPGWDHLQPDMQESLDMILHKIARILNGDCTYADNWHDISGYAKLVEDQL